MLSSHCGVTHQDNNQLGDGLDVGPELFAMGIWVDGTGRRAGDHATQAMLGVYLQKVQHPEQVLRVPPPWLELVANNELPKDLDNPHACSKELTEEPCLRQL